MLVKIFCKVLYELRLNSCISNDCRSTNRTW